MKNRKYRHFYPKVFSNCVKVQGLNILNHIICYTLNSVYLDYLEIDVADPKKYKYI